MKHCANIKICQWKTTQTYVMQRIRRGVHFFLQKTLYSNFGSFSFPVGTRWEDLLNDLEAVSVRKESVTVFGAQKTGTQPNNNDQ